MEKVIYNKKEQKVPIKMWLNDIEDGALKQAKNLSNLPFIHKWVSIMPDSHQGYGMPIGGVIATKNVIIPNAVGVDIGCGMCAVRTSLTDINTDTLKKIMGEIRETIPVGFKHHEEKQNEDLMPQRKGQETFDLHIVNSEYQSALKQIGTLGGGNHFIEIQKGDDGHIWIMLHSGSRNLGYKVAKHYNEVAKELNKKWHTSVPEKYDLAFLPVDTEEAQNYISEMEYCVDFAFANRKLMMDRIIKIFAQQGELAFKPMINIAHNYASLEHHYGKNVWVHRKGATLARKGTIGIIPGSQGSNSYIVEGLGNEESFHSCSHGAGRVMSRTQAKKDIDLDKSKKKMEDKGILHSIRGKNDLDEAPEAYKNISKVMENQKDLVKIKTELKPLAVVKG